MKHFDFRTCIVMLAIFAVGYATCLALHPPPALALSDRIEVGELVADRIIVKQTIGFADGPELYGSGAVLVCSGDIWAAELRAQSLYIFTAPEWSQLITPGRELQNVTVAPDVIGGTGLDVGKLGGHPAQDYVLWSDIRPLKLWLPYLLR